MESCDFEKYPGDKAFLCELCSASHSPCNNSHAACGGCSCSDPDYPDFLLHFMKKLGANNSMMTHLTCDYIKRAFKEPNYNVIDCTDDKLDPEGNISAIRVDVDDAYDNDTLASGIFRGGCEAHPRKIGCDKTPFMLKFECDDCVNKGSPWMLSKCCEKCKEFVDGLESNPSIPNNTLPIAFCSGCDSTHYTFEHSPMPDWPPAPWSDHRLYRKYTEAKAMKTYDDYIEDNICSEMTPPCEEAKSHWDQYGDNGLDCHAGSCPSDPQPSDPHHSDRRLAETNDTESVDPLRNTALASCNFGERKSLSKPPPVSEAEPSDTDDVPPEEDNDGDDTVMPKAIIKATMGLPGTLEMYQTNEARAALRHGFANTLQEVPESWVTVSLNEANGGRRLSDSDVSAEFSINVPSTSTVTTDAITQSVESVDTTVLATNLQESFAEHAPTVDVETIDFREATFSKVESLQFMRPGDDDDDIEPPVASTVTPGPPSVEPPSGGVVGTGLAIVGGGVALGLVLIVGAAIRRRRRAKHNQEADKPNTIGRSQPKEADQDDAKEVPVVPQDLQV